MSVVKTVRLTTRAVTSYAGHVYDHEARVELNDAPVGQFCGPGAESLREEFSYRWSLVIDGTPGRWYMSTLLEGGKIPERLSIDLGQNWTMTNAGDVIREAIEHI